MVTKPKAKAKAKAVAGNAGNAGYHRPHRYRWFELDLGDLDEGVEPLRVRVRTDLSFGRRNDIPVGEGVTFASVFAAIARYVVEWNYQAEIQETGEYEVLPPPAVGGPDVLHALDEIEVLWLANVVKNSHIIKSVEEVAEEKKDSTPSASTDEPANGGEDATETA